MPARIDITGRRYGLLVAVARINGRWACRCDCGGTSEVPTDKLQSGNTRSCGCRKRAVLGESTTKHGGHGTRTYRIWKAMRNRCNNPNTPRYADYGGRGVAVCSRWDDYAAFLADMGECPESMSLDRKDGEKGYSPDNCRWATAQEQRDNALAPYERNPGKRKRLPVIQLTN